MDTLYRHIRKINYRDPNKVAPIKKEIDEKTRSTVKEFYKEDIRELEKLIGRDLSLWK